MDGSASPPKSPQSKPIEARIPGFASRVTHLLFLVAFDLQGYRLSQFSGALSADLRRSMQNGHPRRTSGLGADSKREITSIRLACWRHWLSDGSISKYGGSSATTPGNCIMHSCPGSTFCSPPY